MSYLYTVSAVLLALKLGAVSHVSWELIILPALLQGSYNIIKAYNKYVEMRKLIAEVQAGLEKNKDDNTKR
jgi:hypothetical protein